MLPADDTIFPFHEVDVPLIAVRVRSALSLGWLCARESWQARFSGRKEWLLYERVAVHVLRAEI